MRRVLYQSDFSTLQLLLPKKNFGTNTHRDDDESILSLCEMCDGLSKLLKEEAKGRTKATLE